ncbi:MAG: type II toxin-antitoxin system ParD family antitoxin [Alphaproteobacteria bacterium HGW-Alphaproteobacteria-12]|nr:MAG: type II toxin-antitoxin system ParD family antitoxin [Alphaproteobacteria bacterium HGW-Alphaproteobacteria-12]
MVAKVSISLTDDQAQLVDDAVASGDYASSSEVIREALREWKTKRLIGQLWDEGVTSGRTAPDENFTAIKKRARGKR